MKCGLCDVKKGKRHCPARNSMICAQCCAEKRVLEIDCPENCPYLIAGRQREMTEYRKCIGLLDIKDNDRNSTVFKDHQDVIARLEYVIASERISCRDLTDKDAAQAVDILLETYQTEANGVLYEKTSEDLRVEPLRCELRNVIESLRNPGGSNEHGIVDPQNTRLQLSTAIDCLECIRSMVIAYQRGGQSASGYVNFLARVMPKKDTRSSIILA